MRAGRGLPCRPPAPQRSWTSWTSLPLETGPDPRPGFEDPVESASGAIDEEWILRQMLHGAASNAGVGGHEGLVDCVSHDGLVDALGELRESHDGHARDSVLGLLDDPIENPTLVESRRELLDDPIEGPTAARSGRRGFEVSVHEELARGSMSNPTGRAVGHVDGGHVDDPIETVWDD